jgi:hypothetical protein
MEKPHAQSQLDQRNCLGNGGVDLARQRADFRRKTSLIATQSQSRISRASQVRSGWRAKKMRWWIKALIFSVISSVILVGVAGAVGYLHTDVFLAGQITPAQDKAISEAYGEVAGFGIVVAWVICFIVFWGRRGARETC